MINIFQKSGNTATIIGRDKEGKRTKEEISIVPYYYIKNINGKYKDLYGNKLQKIECNSVWEIRKRIKFIESFEGDVQLCDRILIDKIPKIEKQKLHIMHFDIETLDNSDPETVLEPITCICCYDNFTKKKMGFVWRKDLKEERKVVGEKTVFYFNTEENMLKKFIKYVCHCDFDLLTGWYVGGFDIPYIINRCFKLKVNEVHNLSMHGEVSIKKSYVGDYFIRMNGRYVFDLLKGYRRLTSHQMDSYKLDAVGFIETGEGKVEHKENFRELWQNIPKLLKYCFKDVMLCVYIDEKRNIIGFHDEIRRMVGCRWESIWNATLLHDIVFLRKAKSLGMVLPTKKKSERQTYKGGYVELPIPGLHSNIAVVDLVSLYPNIIRTFNLSPETIGSGDIKVNGIKVDESKKGICSIICEEILIKRAKIKALRKIELKEHGKDTVLYKKLDTEQWALKIVVNSLYGALGTPYFRMYCRDIADTITTMGRTIIQWSSDFVKKLGLNVVYNDTDSVFFEIPNDDNLSNDELEKIGIDIGKKITVGYDDFVKEYGVMKKHTLVMDYEKMYTKIFFGAGSNGKATKKRYAGFMLHKGKEEFQVKGFGIVRSDSSIIEREAMTKVFKMVLKGEEKEEIEKYINGLKVDITNKKYKWSDIAVRRGLKKIERKDMYVKSIDYSNKYLGTTFGKGSRIKMLFVKNNPLTETMAFEFDEQIPDDVQINWKKTFERMFDKKLDRIYTALNWNAPKTKQVTLFG